MGEAPDLASDERGPRHLAALRTGTEEIGGLLCIGTKDRVAELLGHVVVEWEQSTECDELSKRSVEPGVLASRPSFSSYLLADVWQVS